MTKLRSTDSYRALVIAEPGRAEVRQFPSRALKAHEIRVANTFSAVSVGTEYLVVSGRLHGCTFPCLLGYQAVGRIVELGPDVRGYETGGRVCSGLSREQPPGYGMGCGNAHVSHAIVADTGDFAQDELVRVPDAVSDEEAAYAWLGAVARQGVERAQVGADDVVAVVGLGIVGQMAAQISRARGARVYAGDLSPARVELSQRHSADVAVVGDAGALDRRLRVDHKAGATVVIECTGNTEALDAALDLAAEEGRLVLQGHYPGNVSFRFIPAHSKRLTMYCPCAWGDLRPILELMRKGKLTVRPWIEGTYAPEEAEVLYQRIARRDPAVTGALIRWQD